MPAYINWSPEELRVQDYAVGRKTANSAVPGATGFGAAATTGFGAGGTTGGFGQPAAPTTGFGFGTTTNTSTGGGLFGGGTTTTGGFGQPSTTNAFGQPAASAAPANPFGAPAAGTSTGFGTFGSTSTPTNAFGATTNAPKPFGGFGSTPTATTGTGFGTFGQTNTQAATSTQNAFGQQQPASTGFGFGSNANKPGGFGATTNPFGGQTTTGGFGTNTTTNAFGQPAQQAAGGFGAPAPAAGTGTTGFGFGATNQTQPAANPFGQAAQPAAPANPFGAFGQQTSQTAAPTTNAFGNLFGTKPATPTTAPNANPFGGFGQTTTSTATNPLGGGLGGFGATTTNTGGLFGQNTSNAGNIFGAKPTQPAPNTFGGFGGSTLGGFGAAQAAPAPTTNANPFGAFAGFGQSTAPAPTGTTTGLFGTSTAQPQPQQALTASVDQPFSSGIPVFELLPGAAAAAGTLAASAFATKKQPNFFMKRKPLPSAKAVASLNSSTAVNPLRGFAGSVTATKPGQSGLNMMLRGGTMPSTTGTLSTMGSSFMGGTLSEKKAGLSSDVFVSNVKKLQINKDVSKDQLTSSLAQVAARKGHNGTLGLLGSSPSPAPGSTSRPAIAAKPSEPSRDQTQSDKLEKGEYWISPEESKLKSLPFKDLEAFEHFKCGRVGYGQVEFLEPVNLTTIGAVKDIPNKYIIFDERECTVYPDEHDKPPVGQGLNVRARITLENCWAVDRATREPIKDENHPKAAHHLKKLQSMPETTFESFDIQTGEWTFIVEHFSRYGLDEGDDEEEEEMLRAQNATAAAAAPVPEDQPMEKPSSEDDPMEDPIPRRASVRPRDVSMRPRDQTPAHRRRGSTARPAPGEENDADNDEDDMAMDDEEPERPHPSWPAQIGLDPQRLGQMQSSLFAAQNNAASKAARGGAKGFIKPPRAGTPSALGKHPREMSIMEEDGVHGGALQRRQASVERPSFAVARPVVGSQDQQMALEPPARKFVKIAKESLVEGKESLYRDAGLAFGRSFRVGWGPGGMLVHLGELCAPYDETTPPESFSVLNMTYISHTSMDEEKEKKRANDELKLYREHTQVVEENGIPMIVPLPTLNFQPFATHFHPDDTSYEASLWRLGAALFDTIPLDVPGELEPTKKQWIADLRRKMKISDWLQAAVSPAVEQVMLNGSSSSITRVFALLTGNDVERACQVAMDAGDFHLATLLSQAGGDRAFRESMGAQWDTWVKEQTDAFIDDDYRKVYAVLCGIVTIGRASKNRNDPFVRAQDIDIAEGLDWKQAFGLHLWYGIDLADPPTAAITEYDLAQSSSDVAAMRGEIPELDTAKVQDREGGELVNPPPWYLVSKAGERSKIGREGDTLLHMLRLFENPEYPLSVLLNPKCISPHALDYRLPWQLFAVLSGMVAGCLGPAIQEEIVRLNDLLCVAYAMQLEDDTMVDQAIFVALHLSDPQSRASAIRDLLMRNPEFFDEEVVQSYGIPGEWIAAAKGAYERYKGNAGAACTFYVHAGEQKFACDIVISDLAPDLIIREEFVVLKRLFEVFTPERIDDWAVRGKLFLDYIDMKHSIPTLVTAIASQPHATPTPEQLVKADRIFAAVPNLLRLLPSVLGVVSSSGSSGQSGHSKRQRAALDEMQSGLVTLVMGLQNVLVGRARVKLDLRGVEAGARLKAVQSAAYERFCQSVDVL